MKRFGTIVAIVQLALMLIVSGFLLMLVLADSRPWPQTARNLVEAGAIADVGAPNTVSAIYLGYRAFDTLGETVVLLTAVSGTIALISAGLGLPGVGHASTAKQKRNTGMRTVLIEVIAGKLGPVVLMFGVYVMFHGHLSPGGGFQGGVVISSAIAFLALGGRPGATSRLTEQRVLAQVEAVSAFAMIAVSLAGVWFGSGMLTMDIGISPVPESSFIIFLNMIIGLKVGSGIGYMCVVMLGRGDDD